MYVSDGIAYAGEPQKGMRVASVRSTGNLCLLVTFSTGETRLFDGEALRGMPAFEGVLSEDVFPCAFVERGVVCWRDGEVDLAPERMYEMSYTYEKIA